MRNPIFFAFVTDYMEAALHVSNKQKWRETPFLRLPTYDAEDFLQYITFHCDCIKESLRTWIWNHPKYISFAPVSLNLGPLDFMNEA